VKQAVLIRKDLKMSAGKAISQACHASIESVLKSQKAKVDSWRKQGMKKVILKIDSEKELFIYQKKAIIAKLTNSLITDAGKTFFKEPTKTCLAIGPDQDQKIDKITGKLKLLN